MVIEPASVEAGGELRVRFIGPLATSRGGFFVILDGAGTPVAGLWSDKFIEEGPGFTTDMDNFGILDFAVIVDTPDVLVLPPELEPGRYTLCTANSRPDVCSDLEIV